MIHHHPDDDLLLALAAGNLDAGAAIVLGAHVQGCGHCQARLRDFDALGGALLETAEPALLAPDALARTLARIDSPPSVRSPSATPRTARVRASLPDGLPWPSSMAGCDISPWRWLGPGMRWSRVTTPLDPKANLFLLRIGAGKHLPRHTHSQLEVTQVLYGAFDDGRAVFGPGDFDAADPDVHHRPVVLPQGECICLASVNGRVLFGGRVARALGALVGM